MNHQIGLVRMVILACSQAWAAAQPQNERRPGPHRLKVFLDGDAGLDDQIRAEVDFVEYVRDRRRADVQVLVTSSDAGNGRREYTVAFTGFGPFEGMQANAQVGVGQRRSSEAATADVNLGGPDTTARVRRHALRERGAIIA